MKKAVIRATDSSRIENCTVEGGGHIEASGNSYIGHARVSTGELVDTRPAWRHPAVVAAVISALGTILGTLIYVLWG